GLAASIGTLYPVLGRLRAQGLATAFDQPSATGPVRKYYRLTPLGRAQLSAFRLQWAPFTASVHRLIGEDTRD
ncbi:TPA: helix-turn-helix transcriptional regulator, partial [Enterococcus faecium]|nr:helix-turn-helix transcriptional regulator [Enterococcus faecium]